MKVFSLSFSNNAGSTLLLPLTQSLLLLLMLMLLHINCSVATTSIDGAELFVNEVNHLTNGVHGAYRFIEIYARDASTHLPYAGLSANGFVVVEYDTGNRVARVIDLHGKIFDDNGLILIAPATGSGPETPSKKNVAETSSNPLLDSEGAICIYHASSSAFPYQSLLQLKPLSSIVFGDTMTDVSGLVSFLYPGETYAHETETGGTIIDYSLSKCMYRSLFESIWDYISAPSTPGQVNDCSEFKDPIPDFLIQRINPRTPPSGDTATRHWVEILGPPRARLASVVIAFANATHLEKVFEIEKGGIGSGNALDGEGRWDWIDAPLPQPFGAVVFYDETILDKKQISLKAGSLFYNTFDAIIDAAVYRASSVSPYDEGLNGLEDFFTQGTGALLDDDDVNTLSSGDGAASDRIWLRCGTSESDNRAYVFKLRDDFTCSDEDYQMVFSAMATGTMRPSRTFSTFSSFTSTSSYSSSSTSSFLTSLPLKVSSTLPAASTIASSFPSNNAVDPNAESSEGVSSAFIAGMMILGGSILTVILFLYVTRCRLKKPTKLPTDGSGPRRVAKTRKAKSHVENDEESFKDMEMN